jgi:GT2 family glycosyltransferase
MSEFSVVTIVKGRRKQLANLLHSITMAYLQPLDVQIVCMDNIDGISIPEHLNVTLHNLQSEEDLPLAAARNRGIAAARTNNIVFVDADCIVSPSLFSSMLAELTNRVVIAAYPLYLRILPENGNFVSLRPAALPHPARESLPSGVPIPHLQFWSIIFAIQKQTFQQVGGFDQTFTGYGAEDTDFAMTFNKAGIKHIFINDYVLHQYHNKYDPPLNHFDAIIRNAATYRNKWGVYPMQGCLKKFADRGLIVFDSERKITIMRHPTLIEINNSISNSPY